MTDRRTSITVPHVMDKVIEKYMDDNGIKTWNGALWELVRAGIETKRKENPSL